MEKLTYKTPDGRYVLMTEQQVKAMKGEQLGYKLVSEGQEKPIDGEQAPAAPSGEAKKTKGSKAKVVELKPEAEQAPADGEEENKAPIKPEDV